jgi:hypothetical protein
MAKKSKKEMLEFLQKHFRYDIMSSWNGVTSYAARVKLHDGWVPYELQETAYALLEMREPYDDIEFAHFAEFAENHPGYELGFNGSMGGYIVLFRKDSCESIRVDEDDDYGTVKEMYDLVKDFDACVEKCKATFLYYCENYTVEDEEITVQKTVKVLREREEAAA